jgi:hypothetical protein
MVTDFLTCNTGAAAQAAPDTSNAPANIALVIILMLSIL